MTVARPSLHPPRPHHLAAVLAVTALLLVVTVFALVVRDNTTSTVEGSGVAATQARHVAPFTAVELAGVNNVIVAVGQRQAVVVGADANLLNRVTTKVVGGTLVVRTNGSFTTRTPMSVSVNVPRLEHAALTGSGALTLENVHTGRLTLTLAGVGLLRASGAVADLDVSVQGSGDAELGDLVARHVEATVAGSGRIAVTATRSIDASVPGTGAIVYHGNPRMVTTNVTGTGAITRG